MNSALAALVRNDLRLFFSDRRAVIITILVPVMIASFFATIFGGGSGDSGTRATIHLAVSDNDRSAVSQEIVANLRKDPSLTVQDATDAQARSLVSKGTVPVALILPPKLGAESAQAMFAGASAKRPVAGLLYDPSHGPEYQLVRGLVMQQVMQVASQHAFSQGAMGANMDDRLRAIQSDGSLSPDDKSALTDLLGSVKRYYGRPGTTGSTTANTGGLRMPVDLTDEALSGHAGANTASVAHAFSGMAMQGVLFFAIDAAMGMLRDRRLGIWKRLRAAPLSRGALLGSKIASTTLIAVVILSIVFAVGMLFFKIRIAGSIVGFALLLGCSALMVATFGLLIAALGRTEAQSRGYAVPAVLAMSLLGGSWFPAFLMPRWVQSISMAIPSRWAVDGFDAMTWRGFGFGAAVMPCLALLGFAIVFGAIAASRFQWESE